MRFEAVVISLASVVPETESGTPPLLRARSAENTVHGLICCAIFLFCFLIAWPFAEMGFVDDFSYVKTAEVFARTGHIVYNGFATPMLGWQMAWGALFIRLFGFSFTAVKLSTLPVALAAIFLFHAVLLRFGVAGRNAILGTLTLGLSPLFLPLAASYMTDVPGVFVILLCLYCCQRAIASLSSARSIAWLCLAAAFSLAGGTARQIAWLGVLVMVPCAGWVLRRRRGVLPATVLLWAGSMVGVLACLHWFAHQPYSIPESIFSSQRLHHGNGLVSVTSQFSGALLCLLLLIFPLLAASLLWRPRLKGIKPVLLAGVLLLWVVRIGSALPWIPHVLMSEFSAANGSGINARPDQSFELPVSGRIGLSLLVMAAAALLAIRLRAEAGRERGDHTDEPKLRNEGWYEMLWLLGPFTVAYLVLLLPRAWFECILDRYLLELMAVAIILFISAYQRWIGPRLPAICVLILSVYAALAVAGAHDWFAWQRARLAAIDEVRASGVPRTSILGGFDYDGWTQIKDGGYINDPRIQTPVGAWDSRPLLSGFAKECHLGFIDYTPVLQPKFVVAPDSSTCLLPSQYPPLSYRAWLPTFGRIIEVWRLERPPQQIGSTMP